MTEIGQVDIGNVELVSTELFNEILAGAKKTKSSKSAKTSKKLSAKNKPKRSSSATGDYCFTCTSITGNKGTNIVEPYRNSTCVKCGSSKKAFINP